MIKKLLLLISLAAANMANAQCTLVSNNVVDDWTVGDTVSVDCIGGLFSFANFSGDTISTSLQPASLILAIFINANLSGADFSFADLSGADLTAADLSGTDLTGADLIGADLTGVSSGGIIGIPLALPAQWQLINGYLIGPGADLSGANLTNANLTSVNLTGADLTDADLSGADLSGASLSGATLDGVSIGGLDPLVVELNARHQAQITTLTNQIQALEAQLLNEYTLEEIADLRTGSVMLAVSNETAFLSIQILESTNLVDWVELTNTTTATIPVDDASKVYFRFKFE